MLNLIFLVLFAPCSHAHPVPFKDGTAVMTANQPFLSDSMVAYSYHHKAAVAARIMRFDDGIGSMEYYAPQLNFLVKRWNQMASQSNLYFLTAVGPMTYNDHVHSAILTGAEADAESRRLYASVKAEKMWTGVGSDFWHLQSRVGVSPYKSEFNQLGAWLMAQYEYNPILRSRYKLTPLVRLFYRNVLVETGVSTDGDWMANLMVHL